MANPLDQLENPNGTPVALPKKPAFEPLDSTKIKQSISLPDELWLAVLECSCTFPTSVFNTVMMNLIKNPNITSSHLFRADIFYDSESDHSFNPDDTTNPYREGLVKHLKTDLQPIKAAWPYFRLERTIVRQLIPRNPQLDKPLVQTCHIFQQYSYDGDQTTERTLVLYIPHVLKLEEMPFYHPTVSQLAFLHTWKSTSSIPISPLDNKPDESEENLGTLTLLYRFFPTEQLSTKLERTALKLLQTIHKHGQGQLTGYEKRVHHDQLIPQKRYQDTYTRLKAKYGRQLSENWVEVTDPGKHVFEDIGIAAYLIELWRDMYDVPQQESNGNSLDEQQELPAFPGFIDIGCGNGILTYILLSEGYKGSGFDARQRKTWAIFPDNIQSQLKQQILIPKTFQEVQQEANDQWHSGILPSQGTFIISNHADELTAWTPLLAYLNNSSFIAIPCCSHDLSGARFRAPGSTSTARAEAKQDKKTADHHHLAIQGLPQQVTGDDDAVAGVGRDLGGLTLTQAAEIGSLKKTLVQKKMASAYSTLCSYVTSLAEEVGFETKSDVLRIPSTRNACIVGRKRRLATEDYIETRFQKVAELVGRELKKDIETVAAEWIERAEKLMKKPSNGH